MPTQFFVQNSFATGLIPLVKDETKQPVGGYVYGENLRVRYGIASPIKAPVKMTDLRWTKVQLDFVFGDWKLVVADGQCYVMNLRTGGPFVALQGPPLSDTVDVVYACAVPLAYQVWKRRLADENDINSVIFYYDRISDFGNQFFSEDGGGTPCVVLQDGLNQPLLVHPDPVKGGFRVRRAQTYAEWTPDNPEYVPVGYQMVYTGKRLYLVGKGRFPYQDKRIIERSIHGRPLDFMVNVDTNGNKEPNEIDGDAATTSHALDFDPITHISRGPVSTNGLFVSSRRNCFVMLPDTDPSHQVFGEPVFDEVYVANAGAIAQEGAAERNGELTFVTSTGIRSFNGVAQDKTESRNDAFGAVIQPLLAFPQRITAAIQFNDYIYYSVMSIYGPGILVYDTALSTFVSLDRPFADEQIVQFSKIDEDGIYRLFARTDKHNLYELEAASKTLRATIYIGDISVNQTPAAELKPIGVHTNWVQNNTSGEITIDLYVDKIKCGQSVFTIDQNIQEPAPPFTVLSDPQTNFFSPRHALQGFRAGIYIQIDGDCSLSYVAIKAEVMEIGTPNRQKGQIFANNL